jgi:hypothetical protein
MRHRLLALGIMLLVVGAPAVAQDVPLAAGVNLGRHQLDEGIEVAVVTVEPGAARLQVMAAASSWLFDGSFASTRCGLMATSPEAASQLPELDCRRSEALQQQKANPTEDSRLLREYLASGAVAVLSGGYMESFAPPVALGYVSVDGVEISRRHSSWLTSAAICQRDDEVVIAAMDGFDVATFDSCLQAGPLIVDGGIGRYGEGVEVSGAERKLARSVQEQAFVCLDGEGRLLLGVSDPISLSDLTGFLVETLQCRQAMRLSGHITAGLAAAEQTFGHNEVPLHNALGIVVPE